MNGDDLLIERLRALSSVATTDTSAERSIDGPAFTAAAIRRVSSRPSPRSLRRRHLLRRIAVGVIAAALAILPGPRTAFARWLGIGSVRIETGENKATAGVPKSILDLDLGRRSTLTDATTRLGHRVAVIGGRQPTGVWVQQLDAERPRILAINTVYSSAGEVVLLTELPGPGSVYVNKKLLSQDTRIDFLTVRNQPTLWFSGAPHEIAMLDASGQIVIVPTRLVGNVLLWADATRTVRIEGIDDRATAVALLEGLVF